ncbi:selenocysteine-specific translation elongation factor [Denitrovibrio acetiphilus DSM 12809]|uniref:Selenocysteine-specific translation elongation factor n=1 Tax=Denitrovibrio acetiphilus (strain DSM 12809 / NBRC 114555 / N2460) TaxID=522772 RepID=D4H5K3_DENA2|nr:selenocysteine-specific translation elongation factor [Denitrovibrio acetiphilus]ADD67623.1 selenocysteine-specific translation elongation factor [Denitrovibrio acetiphilus DSM 12809]
MKKSLIFGTAGHIDHGKSSLVLALTGKDPDRLKAEKEKGITIELGFAGMETEQANISFVDVPGHEGLIKTMIAGSVGFDSVLFCVDSREGVRQQTIEHYNIIRTIGVRYCVVALTKTDIASPEQIQSAENGVRKLFAACAIKISDIVHTNINDQKSIEKLREAIGRCSTKIHQKIQKRCYVVRADRVFSIKGSGTVVTGTSLFGQVAPDTLLFNIRNMKAARIKAIQVHDKTVKKSVAGERTAINLPDFSIDDVNRGDILSDNKNIISTRGIFANITVFEGLHEKVSLRHNKTYSIYIGALSCEGKLLFYDNKKLAAGERANCFIRLDRPVIPYFDEPLIIRSASPQMSIAGGRVLGIEETFPDRKFAGEILNYLSVHDYDNALKKAVEIFHCGIKLPEPIQFSGLIRNELAMKLAQLNIANFQGFILDSRNLETFVENTIQSLNKKGVLAISKIQHTCEQLPDPVRFDIINRIIERAQKQDYIFDGQTLKKREKDPFEELAISVLNQMKSDPLMSNSTLLSEKMNIPVNQVQKCLHYLCNRSLAKNIEGNNHVTMELLNSFIEKASFECKKNGHVDLTAMKNHFGLPRKLLVPLMEQLDKTGLFVNKDNKRMLKIK